MRLPSLSVSLSLLLACATPAAPGPTPAPTPVEPAPTLPAPTTAPAAAPAPVSVAPDVPGGAAAARDAELARLVTPIVEAYANSDARLTPDGKTVVFISTRDGLPQLYAADARQPAAAARRLVTTGERVDSPLVTPDGASVVYLSDTGADEHWAIYVVPLAGGAPVNLTPGARLQRELPVVVAGKPDTVFYSGRRMEEAASQLYAAPLAAPGEERVLFRDPQPGSLADVSRDGARALWVSYPTQSDNALRLVELATGTATTLYPTTGQATMFDAAFSADGTRAFVATDGGSEQLVVLAFDVATGKQVGRYVERDVPTALPLDLIVADRGDTLAVGLQAGNRGEVRLLDTRTLKARKPARLPLGAGNLGRFGADGKTLTMTWSTADAPPDVYAVEVATGKVKRLREERRPGLDGLPTLDISIQSFRSFDGLAIPLNVYLPPAARNGKVPVIVEFHGGPSGWSEVGWSTRVRWYTSLGYAVVQPNVRGSGGFGRAFEEADNGPKRLDAFKDIEAAGRWVAAQPWADKDRLVIMGGSYGGYTVLVGLTRMPELWRAGVDLYGVASLETVMATTSGLIREMFLLEFGDPAKDAAFLASISPIHDADRIVDPLFVYAGANDPRVPRSESDLIVKALRARGVPVEYMVKDDEGHSLARRDNQIEFFARSARFLEAALR